MPFNERAELIAAYGDNLETLQALVEDLPEEAITKQGTGAEHWSILEVVCHLRDCEERSLALSQQIVREDLPWLSELDPDALAQENDYQSQSLPETMESFKNLRQEHITFLESLPASDWERQADSEDSGKFTLLERTGHMSRHDGVHLAQISRRIREMRS